MVVPESRLEVVAGDPDDDRALACALDGGADYLVTGDRHLLALRQYRHIPMVTARQFLILLAQARAGA